MGIPSLGSVSALPSVSIRMTGTSSSMERRIAAQGHQANYGDEVMRVYGL